MTNLLEKNTYFFDDSVKNVWGVGPMKLGFFLKAKTHHFGTAENWLGCLYYNPPYQKLRCCPSPFQHQLSRAAFRTKESAPGVSHICVASKRPQGVALQIFRRSCVVVVNVMCIAPPLIIRRHRLRHYLLFFVLITNY